MYLDMLRGFATICMILFQSLDMLTDFSWYTGFWEPYLNWVTLFMMIVGFSLQLGYERYGFKSFAKKVIIRAFQFGFIGLGLTYYCGFPQEPFREVVSTIGVYSLLLLPLFAVRSEPYTFAILGGLCLLLRIVMPIPYIFHPGELVGYFCIGVLFAQLRHSVFHRLEKMPGSKLLAFVGRHSLAGYVGHFVIVATILKLLN